MHKENALVTTTQALQKIGKQLTIGEKLLDNQWYFLVYEDYKYDFVKKDNFRIESLSPDILFLEKVESKSLIYFFSEKGYVLKTEFTELQNLKSKNLNAIFDITKDKLISLNAINSLLNNINYILFVTTDGFVKKTKLTDFKVKKNKIRAIKLHNGHKLCTTKVIKKPYLQALIGNNFKVIRFEFSRIPQLSLNTFGRKGMNIEHSESIESKYSKTKLKVNNIELIDNELSYVFYFSKNYFKKSYLDSYRITNKGGRGVMSMTDLSSYHHMFYGNDKTKFLIITTKKIKLIEGKAIKLRGRATNGNKFPYGEIKRVIKFP